MSDSCDVLRRASSSCSISSSAFELRQKSLSCPLRFSATDIFSAHHAGYFCINKFCDVFGLMSIFAFLFRRKGSTNPTVGKDECSRRRRRKKKKNNKTRIGTSGETVDCSQFNRPTC